MNRAGFSLIELLIGLTMLALLAAAATTLVHVAARSASSAARELATTRTMTTLDAYLNEELRDAAAADVLIDSATQFHTVRQVGEAVPCDATLSTATIADTAWSGTRVPQSGRDRVELLTDPIAGTWTTASIIAIDRSVCITSGAPGFRLTLDDPAPTIAVVRVVEPVIVRAYSSVGSDWLGLLSPGLAAPIQPFAGPLERRSTQFFLGSQSFDVRLQPTGDTARVVRFPLRSVP